MHPTKLRLSRLTALMGAAASVILAGVPAWAQDSGNPKDVAALRASAAQYNAAYKARNLAALAAGDTADAVTFLPGLPPLHGPPDPKGLATQFAADPALAVVVTPDRVEVARSGDLAYSVGHVLWTTTNPKSGAVESRMHGDVVVFRKQADGAWKVVAVALTPIAGAP